MPATMRFTFCGGSRLEVLTAVGALLMALPDPFVAFWAEALSASAITKATVITLLFILSSSLSKLIRVEWNSPRDEASVRQLVPANNARRIICG